MSETPKRTLAVVLFEYHTGRINLEDAEKRLLDLIRAERRAEREYVVKAMRYAIEKGHTVDLPRMILALPDVDGDA